MGEVAENKNSDFGRQRQRELLNVLSSCFIIDNILTIRGISRMLSDLLNKKNEDLIGEVISVLSPHREFSREIETRLAAGFFQNYAVDFIAENGDKIPVTLSGFRADMFMTECPYAIINVQQMHDPQVTEMKLLEKTRQLEALLNCAWHDLRGPIATIKGVINVANLRRDDREIDLYLKWIDSSTEKLDQALRKLLSIVQLINRENS